MAAVTELPRDELLARLIEISDTLLLLSDYTEGDAGLSPLLRLLGRNVGDCVDSMQAVPPDRAGEGRVSA